MNKQLVIDMALKAVEDMAHVYDKTHKLTHAGGGDCHDAAMAKIVAIEVMYRATRVRLPKHLQAEIDGLVKTGYNALESRIASQEAEIAKLIEAKRNEFIKEIISEIFDVDVEDIELGDIKVDHRNLH